MEVLFYLISLYISIKGTASSQPYIVPYAIVNYSNYVIDIYIF